MEERERKNVFANKSHACSVASDCHLGLQSSPKNGSIRIKKKRTKEFELEKKKKIMEATNQTGVYTYAKRTFLME